MTDPSVTGVPVVPAWDPREAPPPQALPRRHHRAVTLPSSAVLVVCLFLPAMEVCGKPVIPAQVPMFWSPYVIAAIVFAAALVRPWRLFGLALATRLLIGITVGGFAAAFALETHTRALDAALTAGVLALTALAIGLPARNHELMMARVGLYAGAGSTVWFALLATDRAALVGVHVSVVAAAGMALGCAWWWIEARLAAGRT